MALTTLPAAGAKLRASVLSALFTEVRPPGARKASDQSLSGTSLVDATDLSWPVAANAFYDLFVHLRYNAAAASDIKFGWTYPSGLTMRYSSNGVPVAGSAFSLADLDETTVPGYEGAGAVRDLTFQGLVAVGSTAGTLQLRAAQNTASSTCSLLAGSTGRLLRWG